MPRSIVYDDELQDDKLLRDGQVYRVRMMMRDSSDIPIRRPGWQITDGARRRQPVSDEPQRSYADYAQWLSDAWMGPDMGTRRVLPHADEHAAPAAPRPTRDAQEDAYREYCHRLGDAWRTTR